MKEKLSIDITLADVLPLADLKTMSHDELMLMDPVKFKWNCRYEKIDGCQRFSNLLDFGVAPWYYWKGKRQWISLHENYLLCAKHWKIHK